MITEVKDELKECPFCKGKAHTCRTIINDYEKICIFCERCEAQTRYFHVRGAAFNAWNNRD